MKARTFVIGLIAIFVLLGLYRAGSNLISAAAQSQATPPVTPPTGDDPIAVVKAYLQSVNAGNFPQALASYADDAVVYNPVGVFVGKAEISKFLEIDVKTARTQFNDIKMVGNFVVANGTVSLDRFQKAGIGEVQSRGEYLVQGGKIRFFAPTVTLTSDQQDKMKAAQANATTVATAVISPVDVAKSYVEAANSGDFDKALSFYADSSAALVVNGTLLLSGKDHIASWLKMDVQTTRATPSTWQTVGNAVISTGTVSLERFKKLGVDPVQYRTLYVVENGKIRFFRPFAILTPEQQTIVQAAQGTKTP